MSKSLNGLNAIVTGATSGIGKEVAIQLSQEGVNVCVVGRNNERLKEIKDICKSNGVKVVPVQADLTKLEDIKRTVDQASTNLGNISILVYSAGIGVMFHESRERWDECININLIGLMRITKLILPNMEKCGKGAIINIASVAGVVQYTKGLGPYTASKHGSVGFMTSLYENVKEKGIKVCSIEPGYVDTPMIAGLPLDTKKMIQPQDIATTVLFVLKFPEHACPTSITIWPQHDPAALL